MKKLIVTGANGQLGRAINGIYKGSAEFELVNTDFNVEGIRNLDITNLEDVISLFEEVKPYAVINCAAHTAVDLCEVQKDAAHSCRMYDNHTFALVENHMRRTPP